MGRLLRNVEYKDISLKMLVLLVLLTIGLCLLSVIEAGIVHTRAIEQSTAIIGKALAAHPEIERDIIGAVIIQASPEDISKGRAALTAYGYGVNMPVDADSILGGLFPGSVLLSVAFMLVVTASVLGLITYGYTRIYKKVEVISDAAERVVDGNFNSLLSASGEGDFEILGHRFNQMANRLKLNVEQLMAEKVFLKNIISDISHQLKTPLSTLVVYNDLMAEDENMDAEHRSNFIQMSRQQLQRLEWLIQSLLKMARLEAGNIEFRQERMLLCDVVESAVTALGSMAGDAGISISVHERHAEAYCFGDAPWLTEAVINILKNGIEHSHAGGSIEVVLDQTPLTASMVITDHGMGIDPADIPHIFDRFYRGSRSVKPNSIGIGLAMSKAIVEGQGGSITVKSEKGRGSEFMIVFLRTLGE